MTSALLIALSEPNRLRIVELLGVAPRAVGEIAATLRLRQPQVTKHLRALERAGLVTMHPLGRRRIYSLRREPLRELRRWLEAFEDDHPSEDVLERYHAAIDAERIG
jgi:DNA-binding transcriptional ArsR family regulator